MLEVLHRDGRGRICTWEPTEGVRVESPGLIVPETKQSPLPAWANMVLTSEPKGRDGIVELASGGTWFYPNETEGLGPLVVPAPQPGPTSQVQMLSVGDELAVFHDAGGWASDPKRLLPAFIEARHQATPAKLLWAPALGNPANYAIWAYLGVDLFDASPLLLAAVRGTALTIDGPLTLEQAQSLFGEPGETWDVDRLMAFNLDAARAELRRIQLAIKEGTLRQLAERRAYAHPDTVSLLRRFDAEHHHLEAATPGNTNKEVPCMTWDSLWMPAVERFRRRMRDEYTPPASADVLVLLPCSARKPYRLSKTHRFFARALDETGLRHRVHEVMITSPLGLVPRDMEDVYPANAYDVPVTGNWNQDEEELIRTQLASLLEAGNYKHVVAHVSASTYSAIRDLLPDGTLHTAHGRPSSKPDCDRMRDVLRNIKAIDPQPGDISAARSRKLEDLRGLLSYQFGAEAAAELCEGSTASGRVPYVKLTSADGKQLGQTIMDRGMLSLTLEGAAIVAKHGTKRVQTGDFWIRKTGSLFAVGVESSDPDIRAGDDVVVMFGDEIRGCGQALMSGEDMTHLKRGVAVNLRHIVKQPSTPKIKPQQEVSA